MLLLASIGCGPCPPSGDVVVTGGTSDQQSEADRAIDDFTAWTGGAAVCAQTVELVDRSFTGANDPGREAVGGYRSARRLILAAADHESLYFNVVHELAHALDHAGKITKKREEGDFPYDPARSDYDVRSEASREREAFAVTAEATPFTLDAVLHVADICSDLDVDLTSVDVVRSEVYAQAESFDPPTADIIREEIATIELPADWTIPEPIVPGLSDRGTLLVTVNTPDKQVAEIDPWTGTVITTAPDLQPLWIAAAFGGELPTMWRRLNAGPVDAAGQVVSFAVPLANGDTVPGVLFLDDGQWELPSDPCSAVNAAFLVVDGRPWLIEAAGSTLRWSRWSRAVE